MYIYIYTKISSQNYAPGGQLCPGQAGQRNLKFAPWAQVFILVKAGPGNTI